MDWVYFFLLLALLVVGLGITLMNLPGLWLMAASAGLYVLVTHARYLWPWGMIIILALCLVGEALEFVGKAAGAGKAGGSKRAMLLATIGGVLGGLLLSIPVPIIGTVAGVCIGAFVGAMVGQLTIASDVGHSATVGWGAAKGTLIGILLKVCVGVVILLFTAWRALPIGASAAAAPTTLPAPPTTSGTATTAPTTLPTAVEAP
jgi:uncharacterized protein YqgC (DUF456 family)